MIKKENLSIDKIALFVICITIIVSVLGIYLQNPFFWYDEAAQFYISKGLNQYSPPDAPSGSLKDVIVNNSNYNMDSGGFSVFLYFWSLLSNNWLFLRLLPTFFSILYVIFLFLIAKKELKSNYFAIFVAIIPFMLPYMSNRLTELRAYSMEMSGVVIGIWLLSWCKVKFTRSRIFTSSIILALFSTARYGSLISCSLIAVLLFVVLLMNSKKGEAVQKFFLLSIPMVLSVGACALMMNHQNSNASQMDYSGYISNDILLLLHPMSLLLYVVVLSLIVKIRKRKCISDLQIVTTLIGTVYFILSCLGLYPWDLHRTISVYVLLYLWTFVELSKYIQKLNVITARAIPLLLLLLFFCTYVKLYDKLFSSSTITDMNEYKCFKDTHHNSTIFVSFRHSPILRYQYEYGTFVERRSIDNYPEHFVFQMGRKHSRSNNNQSFFKLQNPSNSGCDYLWGSRADGLKYGLNNVPDCKKIFYIE